MNTKSPENDVNLRRIPGVDASRSQARREKRRRLATTSLVAATALTSLVGGAKLVDNAYFKPDRERHADEVAVIEGVQSGEIEGQVKDALVVLRPGTRLRKTPHSTSVEPGRDNVAKELKQGKGMIIDRPFTHTDDHHQTWYAFRTQTDGPTDTEATPVSADEIADEYLWVNVTALEGQENSQGLPYVEQIYSGHESDMTATFDSNGYVTTVEDTAPVATGTVLSEEALNLLVQSSQR